MTSCRKLEDDLAQSLDQVNNSCRPESVMQGPISSVRMTLVFFRNASSDQSTWLLNRVLRRAGSTRLTGGRTRDIYVWVAFFWFPFLCTLGYRTLCSTVWAACLPWRPMQFERRCTRVGPAHACPLRRDDMCFFRLCIVSSDQRDQERDSAAVLYPSSARRYLCLCTMRLC